MAGSEGPDTNPGAAGSPHWSGSSDDAAPAASWGPAGTAGPAWAPQEEVPSWRPQDDQATAWGHEDDQARPWAPQDDQARAWTPQDDRARAWVHPDEPAIDRAQREEPASNWDAADASTSAWNGSDTADASTDAFLHLLAKVVSHARIAQYEVDGSTRIGAQALAPAGLRRREQVEEAILRAGRRHLSRAQVDQAAVADGDQIATERGAHRAGDKI